MFHFQNVNNLRNYLFSSAILKCYVNKEVDLNFSMLLFEDHQKFDWLTDI